MQKYQLKIRTPMAVVAVCCDEGGIISAEYLPPRGGELPPQNLLARETARQIRAYFKNPRRHRFDLPLYRADTPHRQKVRDLIAAIPAGETQSYGAISAQINSCAQAVGNACRANLLPLIIPCHRVVGKSGIGGFMGGDGESQLRIKKFLLHHEKPRGR